MADLGGRGGRGGRGRGRGNERESERGRGHGRGRGRGRGRGAGVANSHESTPSVGSFNSAVTDDGAPLSKASSVLAVHQMDDTSSNLAHNMTNVLDKHTANGWFSHLFNSYVCGYRCACLCMLDVLSTSVCGCLHTFAPRNTTPKYKLYHTTQHTHTHTHTHTPSHT